MPNWENTPYGAVPAQEAAEASPQAAANPPVTDATDDQPDKSDKPQAAPLDNSLAEKVFYLALDVAVASVAVLFAVFGFLVYSVDGKPVTQGYMGSKLVSVSQYAPTIFPALFAAIVGRGMKSIASWRIQTKQGATVGLVEQCMGSQSISAAFITQARLRAANVLGFSTIILWCLSPLGSQASLRVISVVPSHPSSSGLVAAMSTASKYRYGAVEHLGEAQYTVGNPVIASMMAATLLGNGNQDIWGNIRSPAIEYPSPSANIGGTDTGNVTKWTYPSLVGTPSSRVPARGDTSFVLPASYISLSCPVFGSSTSEPLINRNGSNMPLPNNGVDCKWANATQDQYLIAISVPCSASNSSMQPDVPRSAPRKLLWQSLWPDLVTGQGIITRAECEVTTTHVDTDVACDPSGSLARNCYPTAVRRSDRPPFHGNWTVLDIDLSASTPDDKTAGGDALSVIHLLANLFLSGSSQTGGQALSDTVQPVVAYLSDPSHIVGRTTGEDPSSHIVRRRDFELRLAQLLNTILYVGINPPAFTGAFDPSQDKHINLTSTETTSQDIVRCDRAWLGVLTFASLVTFIFAVMAIALRMATVAPDVLGSISVVLLDNRIDGIVGSSAWSAEKWTRKLKNTKLCLADVDPGAEVGRIALVTTAQDGLVSRPAHGRYYA